jgi:diguanylate cyclase (GGDEF)-like protein
MKNWDIGDLPGLKKSIEAIEGIIGSDFPGSLENYRSILSGINDAACVLNDSGAVIYLNPAFEELSGEASRFIGKSFTLLFEEGEARSAAALLSRAVSGESLVAELALKNAGNTRSFRCFPLKDGSGLTHAVCLIGKSRAAAKELDELMEANRRLTEEIRESRNAESEKLVFLKNYDPVTGLFNRQHFIELLGGRLGAADKGALLLIDIDQFKFISDSYGHGMGDEFLRRVARLLQFNVRYLSTRVLKDGKDEVLLSRLSGDEFAVYLPSAGMVESVETAERLRSAIECFYQSDMHCHMTASIGIALSPEHGTTATGLLTKADAAMYRAKEQGRNRFHLYSPEEREIEQMHMRLKWKENILSALKDGRFSPWYQPIIGLADNRVTHYEVLARMTDLDGSIVLPGHFIDIAERFGLVGAISRDVFVKAFALQEELQKAGRPVRFCLNVSGKELGDREFLYFLRGCMMERGLDPGNLVFEITETASISDMDKAMSFISALKEMGCHVALDDFGIGFTSFLYLREMQVDYIKIAGSFIKSLDRNLNDQLFVKAITEVARGMGIKTIGEFVETGEILSFLRKFGVDHAQGYLIGRPASALLPSDEVPALAN